MPQRDEAWLRHQQTRWLRPDGERWLRPDAARFLIPGTDPAEVFPVLARKQCEPRRFDRAVLRDLADDFSDILALRRELDAIKLELLRRRTQADLKYSPSQPRIPAGQTGGGRWTSGAGGVATTLDPALAPDSAQSIGDGDIGATAFDEGSDLFQISPSEPDPTGDQLAGDLPVDLAEEEQQGGHAIVEHVGQTNEFLKNRVREEAWKTLDRGDYFGGLSVGSFTSLQSANRLVNSTISQNQDKIDEVASGSQAYAILESTFRSPTGYEAYLPRANAEPYMRDTYGVRMVVLRDRNSDRGWRIQSAFPILGR